MILFNFLSNKSVSISFLVYKRAQAALGRVLKCEIELNDTSITPILRYGRRPAVVRHPICSPFFECQL